METAVPGVFIAGVIASGFDANRIFIENGRDHGTLIAARLVAGTERRLHLLGLTAEAVRGLSQA